MTLPSHHEFGGALEYALRISKLFSDLSLKSVFLKTVCSWGWGRRVDNVTVRLTLSNEALILVRQKLQLSVGESPRHLVIEIKYLNI